MERMKWRRRILLMAVLFFLLSSVHTEPAPGMSPLPPSLSKSSLREPTAGVGAELRLTIVYDNNDYDPRLETKWGFSCLIEGVKKTILFDTGGDSATLLKNMKKLEIDPAKIGAVVLSHIHGDHLGGLSGFLKENSGVVVFLLRSFPESLKEEVRSISAAVNEVSEPGELFPGVYTTGELGNGIKEQSLAIKTSKGLVIVTGCAHPGVVRIVRGARQLAAEDTVCLVLGGFHLAGAPTSQIESIVKEFRHLSVQRVAPCHCSGDETRRLFRREYGDDYVDSGVGKRITVP
jgi:7,8-dihydropterin-6-yl-methyl-4-(beta-D-ribofuranosyl)aminobenzene 5'-phosphate synthase